MLERMANRTVHNFSAICLAESQLLISRHPVDKYIMNYIFPIQFALGIIGNGLNLLVLLSKKMRISKDSYFLAAMAMADMLTLSALMFRCLASYDSLARNPNFYAFFNEWKNILIALVNWFSAASIW